MTMLGRMAILAEVGEEREYQENRKGFDAEADDRENGPSDWVLFITRYATRWFPGGFPPFDGGVRVEFRRSMIKVAALAVAAIEQFDRQHPELAKIARKRQD